MRSWTLNAVLFAVGCLLAADTANEVVAATPLAPSSEQSAARPSRAAAVERSWIDRQVIRDRHPSDSDAMVPAPPPVPREDLETSGLPLTLRGTFAANEPSLSRATLYDRERKETLVVGIGDRIEDQALVVRIEQGRVVLRENGAPRELILEAAEQGASPVTRSAALDSENEHAFFNPLLGQGRVLPKFEDGGQMVGLEVSLIQAGSHFEEIGLANGDVITEFDGVPVDSQAQIVTILQKMSDADEYHMVGRRVDGSGQVWDFVR